MVDYLYNYNYINNLISLPPLIPPNAFFQTTKLLRYDTLRLLRNIAERFVPECLFRKCLVVLHIFRNFAP